MVNSIQSSLPLSSQTVFQLGLLEMCLCLLGQETSAPSAKWYSEPFRPGYHFSPLQNWMNDPNGMFYYKDEYHLFYQYNPFGNKWGHMSWGHAVSPDLVHWKHLPIALQEAGGEMIFSGSAVVDWENTSGFGNGIEPPLVAVYTGHRSQPNKQVQCLAYSHDRGRSWAKFDGNPVIDIDSENFRDPKVFWHKESKRWVMALALSAEKKVRFYGSKNLREWAHLSDFGPAGALGGVWECPDLFQLKVENDSASKWLLQVDLGSGSVAGGSGGQYFVGEFDGSKFIPEPYYDNPQSREASETIPGALILADFEGFHYGDWQAQGDAFGSGPARGTLPNQQPVTGFKGSGLVNSFLNGDSAQGTLRSPEFVLTGGYIHFLIGGGNHPHATCLNLLVNETTVKTATGSDSETLNWVSWNVEAFRNQKARLEIVDRHSGGWGHVNVDHILLSDIKLKPRNEKVSWVDYGKDFYAAVSWSDIPDHDGRRLWLGWLSNWQYAQDVPTHPWRSIQSIPRSLSLRRVGTEYHLIQEPIEELCGLRKTLFQRTDITINQANGHLRNAAFDSQQLEIILEIDPGNATQAGIEFFVGQDEKTVAGYDKTEGRTYLDRTQSGLTGFHGEFPGIHSAALEWTSQDSWRWHLFLDRCSAEVFIDNGRVVITDLVFPSADSRGLRLFADAPDARLKSIQIWELEGIWD